MKKLISIFCILSIILALCACGNSSGQESGSESDVQTSTTEKQTTEETPTEETEAVFTIEDQTPITLEDETSAEPVTAKEIFLGSPVTKGNLQFTLTGISEFVDQYSPDDVTFYDVSNAENYSFILVYFTLENTGEEAINPSFITMEIISDGERVHSENRTWYYDADCINLETAEVGTWVAVSPKLEKEDGVRDAFTVFEIADKILDSDVSLELRINIKDDVYFYTIR